MGRPTEATFVTQNAVGTADAAINVNTDDAAQSYPSSVGTREGFSRKLENLIAAVSMFMAYYNFVWRTRYPDYSGRRGQLRLPAAMLARAVDTLWDFERLFDEAMAYC